MQHINGQLVPTSNTYKTNRQVTDIKETLQDTQNKTEDNK